MTTDPRVGQEVDGYRILEELGRGGMGIVYKVLNIGLNRTEALKIVSPMLLQHPQFLRRFQREAQALAHIHNPHIVTVYTIRESALLGHYITMEYVDGRSLADYMAQRTDTGYQAARPLIKQMLSAFAYAHERGVLHRDIKPANIMLTKQNQVKVMDFGLAQFYLNDDITQSRGVSGTIKYMSPEQIQGHPLDQRSDLFSLGITIYELLAGRLPFDVGNSQFAIQRAILEEAFPPLHSHDPTIPVPLSDIVMKALAKEPDERYQVVDEMLAALEAFEASAIASRSHVSAQSSSPALHRAPSAFATSSWQKLGITGVVLAVVVSLALALAPRFQTSPDTSNRAALSGTGAEETSPVPSGLPADSGAADQHTEASGASTTPSSVEPASLATDQTQVAPAPSQDNTPQHSNKAPATAASNAASNLSAATQEASDPPDEEAASATDAERFAEPDEPPVDPERLADATADTLVTTQETAGTVETAGTAEIPEAASSAPTQPPPKDTEALVRQQLPTLVDNLKYAIMEADWNLVPEVIARFYQKKLRDVPRRLRVTHADILVDTANLRVAGDAAYTPVTVYLTLQQKGREGTQAIPIPARWVWERAENEVGVMDVQDN